MTRTRSPAAMLTGDRARQSSLRRNIVPSGAIVVSALPMSPIIIEVSTGIFARRARIASLAINATVSIILIATSEGEGHEGQACDLRFFSAGVKSICAESQIARLTLSQTLVRTELSDKHPRVRYQGSSEGSYVMMNSRNFDTSTISFPTNRMLCASIRCTIDR